MFKSTFLVIFFISQVFCNVCSNANCPIVPKHYEELGCQPIYKSGGCCPERFNCDEFRAPKEVETQKCYHKGKTYSPRELLPTDSTCTKCWCHGDISKWGSIVCSDISNNCREPDFENSGSNCTVTYDEFGCCENKVVCDKDLETLSTCNYNGKTYYEGQKIKVDESCYSCTCDKNFNENESIFESKSCKRTNCNMDKIYKEQFEQGCLPVYYGTPNCCPTDMLCPNKTGPYIFHNDNKGIIKDDNFCEFKDFKLPVGDSFQVPKTRISKIKCKCELPPYFTCIRFLDLISSQ